jgi:glycosyltransferase involved in cell wall biosynthesis
MLPKPGQSSCKEIQRLRIAQVSPLTEPVPPKLYGGIERVISWLTEELVALRHDVTLFASGDSVTSARLEPMWPRALRLDGSVRDPNALHTMMVEQVCRRAKDFDLLHFHLDYYPFSVMSRQAVPFVTTLHRRLDLPEHKPVFVLINSLGVDFQCAAASGTNAKWIGTVYHGLPENLLKAEPTIPSYLAFLGRISPEKAVDRAIRIAERCGLPLKIAAKVDAADQDYFVETILPPLSKPHVDFIGEITDAQKSEFLSGAVALID